MVDRAGGKHDKKVDAELECEHQWGIVKSYGLDGKGGHLDLISEYCLICGVPATYTATNRNTSGQPFCKAWSIS